MVVAIIYNNNFFAPAYIIIWVLLVLKKMKLIIIYIDIIRPIEEFSQNKPTSNRVKKLKNEQWVRKKYRANSGGIARMLGVTRIYFKKRATFF